MKNLDRISSIALLIIVLVLILTNPTEEQFLNRVAGDYGTMHHGLTLDAKQLLELGEKETQSYFLFGVYSYRFGTISVSYIGLLGTFIKLGSETRKQEDKLRSV